MAEDSGNEFTNWLSDLGEKYKTLNSDQKNQTLDLLIGSSEGAQLYHLTKQLNSLLKRDFLGELPREVVFQILFYLDTRTLLQCSVVSRRWAEAVNSCTEVWRRVCLEAGLLVKENIHDALYYKNRYMQCSSRLKSLQDGVAFEQKMLFGHRDRVMAVYYRDGKLATGSDDHSVRIWDCDTGQCIKIFQTHTVADVKFDENIVITASFDTTVACWDYKTGKLLHQFTGHVAAVFSVDYSRDLDLLITGSADSTVKIWSLSGGQMIRTLPQHRSTWITQVRLVPVKQQPWYYILSRDNATLFLWKMSKTSNDMMDFFEWVNPDYDPVPGVQVREGEVDFAAVNVHGPNIDNICSIINYDLMHEYSQKLRKSHQVKGDSYIQAFLGCGKCYDVVLTQADQATVDVVRQTDLTKMASVSLPQDYRQSKRGSTFCLGERAWLDGFDGENDHGLFFAASLRDNTILLISWRYLNSGSNVENTGFSIASKTASAWESCSKDEPKD